MKVELTVPHLVKSGFIDIGCWELAAEGGLTHSIVLPTLAGVYAFAIDEIVQYVGLASRSVKQRLNFYRKPGETQCTNIRLNGVISDELRAGTVVRILVAHPKDCDWNGLTVKGAEGLEAGLISEFALPWNVRGATKPAPVDRVLSERQTGRHDKILALIDARPGLTGGEIAHALYGPTGQQPQINTLLRTLMASQIIRRDEISRPYRYYLCTQR